MTVAVAVHVPTHACAHACMCPRRYYKGPGLLDEPFPLDPKSGPWDIAQLHRHLVECVRADATEGPLVERIKQNIGLECKV